MSIVVISRNKTDGSYTLPALYDVNASSYGNEINGEFSDIKNALKFIETKGNKLKVYFICEPVNRSIKLTDFNNCGNNYYVLRKYSILNGKWTRICLTNGKVWDSVHGYGARIKYGIW